jgi:hypothetical protein
MNKIPKSIPAVILIMTVLSSTLALGQPQTTSQLANAVPEDAYILIHGFHNPERKAIEELWGPFMEALGEAELHKDVLDMCRSFIPGQEQEEFDGIVSMVTQFLEGVDWLSLIQKEVLYTSRMAIPVADYLVYFRCDPKKVEGNVKGFKAIFEMLGSLDPNVRLSVEDHHGAKVWKIGVEQSRVPFALYLASKDDLIALSMGQNLLIDSLAMLAGESESPRLVDSAPFKKAMKLLPPPEDTVTFFNLSGIFGPLVGFIEDKMEQEGAPDNEAKLVISLMTKIINMLDMFEGIATVETTDGYKSRMYEIALTKPGIEETPLGKIFAGMKPIKRFDAFVPKEATSFSVGSGIDFKALYSFIVDFIKTEVPDGAMLIEQWKGIQAQIQFDMEKDFLDWLGLEYVSVSLPAAVTTPFGGGDSVFLMEIKDAEVAMKQINRGIEVLKKKMEELEQPLIIRDVEIEGAQGFQSITHPMIMAFLKPVIGVHGDRLIVGTSKEAIETCLATSKGEHPTIKENERFKAEGLKPLESMYAISYTDQSGLAEEIGGIIQGVSMGLNMASAFMVHEEPEAGRVLQSIGSILGKLGPIVSEIDFYLSSASITKCGEGYTLTERVTNYRPPKKEVKIEDV